MLKEMELLVEFFKVPQDQLGIELDNPLLESCYICDALFEKTHLNVIALPFCGHRVHLDCLRQKEKLYCSFCGNGVRSSLLSYLRGQILEQIIKNNVKMQE